MDNKFKITPINPNVHKRICFNFEPSKSEQVLNVDDNGTHFFIEFVKNFA